MRVARSLGGLSEDEDDGVIEVRRRWNLLAERLGLKRVAIITQRMDSHIQFDSKYF